MYCLKGKVQLPLLKEPLELLVSLFNGNDHRSQQFLKNIRAYNNLFCFTSIGGRVDTSLSNGIGLPQFILCDQNYHRIGSLLPMADAFSIRLFRHRATDPQVYSEPTVAEIAGLIVGDFDRSDAGRDIIVQSKNRNLQCIHETHTCYWPLQYPLLFPYGKDGYQEDIPYRHVRSRENIPIRQRVSLREFVCFRIQEREAEFGTILKSSRLFQQFIVDSFSIVESQRLSYIRFDQKNIRCHMLQSVEGAIERGDIDASSVGTRIVLPFSFTVGRRYMFNNCQDAMSICKQYGYPDLFITITCNPSWLEFKRYTERTHIPVSDRPDLTCRLFELKVQFFMTDLKEGVFFGPVNAGMNAIEFQKRGLPHAHILIWLQNASRMQATETIDEVISVESPDPTRFPKLYSVVTKYMIHGPCGKLRPSSPCMKNGSCSKFCPKKFVDSTSFDKDGYPIYKRRNMGVIYTVNGVDMDNRFVVPYNPMLFMKYRAHINLEFCNKSNVIKYLFKYINKGPDCVTAMIRNVQAQEHGVQIVDEIKQFYDCWYLAPCESAWRSFAFHIRHKWPCVQRLTFHLPGRQNLIFADDDKIPDIVDKNRYKDTMFTAWMQANKGCRSFESNRTIDGVLYDSFKDACNELGLLIDDREFINAIKKNAELSSGSQRRRFFVTLLASNSMVRPDSVWRESWRLLADDILYHKRRQLQLPERKIVLNVASSGIASLLLPGGRTTHSLFCFPIDLNEESVVVLGGDFRQVLPVIPKGTRAEIVMASINSLILWKYCSCGVQKEDEIIVDIPSDLLISPTDNPIQDIVSAIYSDIHVNHDNALYFQERVIVAPTVDIVQQINDFVVDTIPGLENITCSGIPKHVLKLKKGAPIILLRNIDQENGLCNGTRLIVQDLGDNIIGAEVVSESNVGDKVFIPRMNLVPSDPGIPFKFQRR
ncbi:hypothetical protein AHAS_Ahas19G0236600 [Arachis hypogaea]